jgi:hypothetical protein
MRLESAKVDSLPPRNLLSRPHSGFTVGGDGETQALFDFLPPSSSREQKASVLPSDWRFSGEMRDSRGKVIALTQPRLPPSPSPWAATSPVGKSLLISLLPTVRYSGEHGPIWELRLPVRDVPHSRGEVFYQGMVSYKECWPRPFKIKLRSLAEITPSPSLKIIGATQNGSQVEVLVGYTGTRTLEWQVQLYDSSMNVLPPLYPDFRNYLGDRTYSYGKNADTDYLVTNWSQRVQIAGKPAVWNGCDVASITPLPNKVYKVSYSVPNSADGKSLGAKRVFRGEIGLKGHGFLPFSVALKAG